MDERYLDEVEACGLFGAGICEICGKTGSHPACEAKARESERRFQEADVGLLEQHAEHGRRGIVGEESQASFDQAVDALQRYLGRALECDLDQSIEGDAWWYIPEEWIGMIGFIVEKRSLSIYPLGSGLYARYAWKYPSPCWCGILEYLDGRIEPVDVSAL